MKIAFTIATTNYLAHAKTLADSFTNFHPEYHFVICLIGKKSEVPSEYGTTYHIQYFEDLSDSRVREMREKYNDFELSCNLKPFFASHLIEQYHDCNRLKYIDSDIIILSEFNKSIEADNNSSIFLTPHNITSAGVDPDNADNDHKLLKNGVYNGGYFELNLPESESLKFLEWWKEVLFHYGKDSPYEFQFVDQLWLNLVPCYFRKVCIILDPTYNVAIWNLKQRNLECKDGRFRITVDEQSADVTFFHYSRFDLKHFKTETDIRNQTQFNLFPEAIDLIKKIEAELVKNGVHDIFGYFELKKPRYSLKSRIRHLNNKYLKKTSS